MTLLLTVAGLLAGGASRAGGLGSSFWGGRAASLARCRWHQAPVNAIDTHAAQALALLQRLEGWDSAPLVAAAVAGGGDASASDAAAAQRPALPPSARRLTVDLPALLNGTDARQLRQALQVYQHDFCTVLDAQRGLPGGGMRARGTRAGGRGGGGGRGWTAGGTWQHGSKGCFNGWADDIGAAG